MVSNRRRYLLCTLSKRNRTEVHSSIVKYMSAQKESEAIGSLARMSGNSIVARIGGISNHVSSVYFSLCVTNCPTGTHGITISGYAHRVHGKVVVWLDHQESSVKSRKGYFVNKLDVEPNVQYHLRAAIKDEDRSRWTRHDRLCISITTNDEHGNVIGSVGYNVPIPLIQGTSQRVETSAPVKRTTVERPEPTKRCKEDTHSQEYTSIAEFERAKSEALIKMRNEWDAREAVVAQIVADRLHTALADLTNLIGDIEKVPLDVREKVIKPELLAKLKSAIVNTE